MVANMTLFLRVTSAETFQLLLPLNNEVRMRTREYFEAFKNKGMKQ